MNRVEAEELLPWFVAGTLSDDESRAVQAFVDSGEISQRDIQELELFAETIADQSADEPAYNPEILQNAMRQLDDIEQLAPDEPLVVPEPNQKKWGLDGFFKNWGLTPMFAKVAIGAQFALVVALGMWVAGSTGGDLEGQIYTPVSGGLVSADLTVAFAPGVTEAQMRELLISLDATIVSGPNSLGMYNLAVEQADQVGSVSGALQGNPLVKFLQPAAKQ